MSMEKYAVVTGGSQGIGKGIAQRLLEDGYNVFITARTAADINTLLQEWQTLFPGRNIAGLAADLSKPEECKRLGIAVTEAFPYINVLVNNAGAYVPGNITDEPDGQLITMMEINLYSAYHVSRNLMHRLKDDAGSAIFNMCSVASLKAYPGGGSYSISKYALLGFSDNLREELRARRIKVVSVCPGAVYTRSWAGSGVPENRIMEAEDIATVIISALHMSIQAVPETIVLRPVAGDL